MCDMPVFIEAGRYTYRIPERQTPYFLRQFWILTRIYLFYRLGDPRSVARKTREIECQIMSFVSG
jgi:hypothetical protein